MLAIWFVQLLQIYAAVGVVFGTAFVLRGAQCIDPVAREGTRGFRALIFPGAAALWPILLPRWIAAARHGAGDQRDEPGAPK